MSFLSLSFTALVILGTLVARAKVSPSLREWVWLILSAGFALTFITPLQLILLAGFSLLGYAGILGVLPGPLLVILGAYLYLKGYLGGAYALTSGIVGLSYILFRIIQTLLQVQAKLIPAPGLRVYFLHLFFFPAFLSGPVEGIDRFQLSLKQARKDEDDLSPLFRMAWGLFKLYYVSRWFEGIATLIETNSSSTQNLLTGGIFGLPAFLVLALTAVAYFLQLYLNFSGYMDIGVSAGRLLGIKVPENFDEPLRARNFVEFWKRWHITVSDWFKDQVFSPLFKYSVSRFARTKRHLHRYWAAGCLFLSFLLMGVWHGAGLRFIIYGVFLGFGVALPQLVPVKLRLHDALKRALTLGYFTACLILIHYQPGFLRLLFQNLPIKTWVATVGAIGLFWIPLLLIYDGAVLVSRWILAQALWIESRYPLWVGPSIAAVAVYFLILFGIARAGKVPVQIIYRTF